MQTPIDLNEPEQTQRDSLRQENLWYTIIGGEDEKGGPLETVPLKKGSTQTGTGQFLLTRETEASAGCKLSH